MRSQKKKWKKIRRRATTNLPKKGWTIAQFQKRLGIKDEISAMVIIAKLEIEGKLQIAGYYKGFRPNGCAFYLAKYGPSIHPISVCTVEIKVDNIVNSLD